MGELHEPVPTPISHTSSSSSSGPDSPMSANKYKVHSSRLLKVINWWHLISVYLPTIQYALVALLVAQLLHDVSDYSEQIKEFMRMLEGVKTLIVSLLWKVTPLFILAIWYFLRQSQSVYLVDFCTYKPPEEWKISQAEVMEIMRRKKCFTTESLAFMERILANSGTGPATAWPPGIVRMLKGDNIQADVTENGARHEIEAVVYTAIQDVLSKTGVKPKDIDILIINCSLFSPTPSLCAMVAHHFKMRSDLLSYNLSGMGCSAGLVSIDLAKRLLESRPRSRALVVSTENLTQAFYHGNDRAFLLQNTLFRCGGAAMLLSNRVPDGLKAKYKLLHLVRTQGNDDQSYEAVFSTQDEKGEKGVRLSKEIVKVAGKLMERNLTMIGPQILPVTELAKVLVTVFGRQICSSIKKLAKSQGMVELASRVPEVKIYQPNFKRALDHFCVHAGGRGVLDGIEKNLRLDATDLEASRMTLYNYGNTSSSSIWYELEYIQEHMQLKRGQRILQLAFGSGFKCNSAVWVSLKV